MLMTTTAVVVVVMVAVVLTTATNERMNCNEYWSKEEKNEIVKCTLNMGNSPLYALQKILCLCFFIAFLYRVLYYMYMCVYKLTCVFFPFLSRFRFFFVVDSLFLSFLVRFSCGQNVIKNKHKHTQCNTIFSFDCFPNWCAFNWI